MDFNFTDEQNMLRDTVAKFVQNQYDFDTCLLYTSPSPRDS